MAVKWALFVIGLQSWVTRQLGCSSLSFPIREPYRTHITWDPNAGFSESLQTSPSNGPEATFTSAAFNLTVERESETTIRLSWSHQANLRHLRHKKNWPYNVRIVPIEGGQHMEARVSTNGKQHILLHELDPEGSYQLIVSKNNRILLNKLMRLGSPNRQKLQFSTQETAEATTSKPIVDEDSNSTMTNLSSKVIQVSSLFSEDDEGDDEDVDEDDDDIVKLPHESEEALNELELATATYEDRFRIEELGIVTFVLVLWMGAIVLFVHRWGKIRMLIPHQPQYVLEKEDPPVSFGPPTHSMMLLSSPLDQFQPNLAVNHHLHVMPGSQASPSYMVTSNSFLCASGIGVPIVSSALVNRRQSLHSQGDRRVSGITDVGGNGSLDDVNTVTNNSDSGSPGKVVLPIMKDGTMQTKESHLYQSHCLASSVRQQSENLELQSKENSLTEVSNGDSEDESRRSKSAQDNSLSYPSVPMPVCRTYYGVPRSRLHSRSPSQRATSPFQISPPQDPGEVVLPPSEEAASSDMAENENLLPMPLPTPSGSTAVYLTSGHVTTSSMYQDQFHTNVTPSGCHFPHQAMIPDTMTIDIPSNLPLSGHTLPISHQRAHSRPSHVLHHKREDECQNALSRRRRPSSWTQPRPSAVETSSPYGNVYQYCQDGSSIERDRGTALTPGSVGNGENVYGIEAPSQGSPDARKESPLTPLSNDHCARYARTTPV
ncbi:uncharacterized protein LOC131886891 isoform X2 [Tigriopus californicus]|uniref:uncharacterized protein LOC131886891 isoform X2 n=1 Tax=Tigriopus californicus TaxID=6832 RepID=UPI0027D9F443|nr:uncharacterized protein LOC131886891 isoform X2 [Tigriopus californicus]